MLVQTEAIITQLVFDHSLRIRMKSETSSSPSTSRASTAVHTPDNASIAEATDVEQGSPSRSNENGSEDETVHASSASTTSATATKKGSDTKKTEEKLATAGSGAPAGNLIGRINNLVTTDLNNLVDGRDFLFIGEAFPPRCMCDLC